LNFLQEEVPRNSLHAYLFLHPAAKHSVIEDAGITLMASKLIQGQSLSLLFDRVQAIPATIWQSVQIPDGVDQGACDANPDSRRGLRSNNVNEAHQHPAAFLYEWHLPRCELASMLVSGTTA